MKKEIFTSAFITKTAFTLLAILVMLGGINKAQAQINIAAVNQGDDYIRQDLPGDNQGSNFGFSVQWYQPFLATNHGLIEFALPSGSATITKISLFIYAGGCSGTFSDCNIYQANSTFNENSVTWSSAPGDNGTIISSASSFPSGTTEGWKEFVLRGTGATNSLNSLTWGSTAAFRIRFGTESGSSKSFWFYSKEYSDASLRPYIQITYVPPVVVPTVTSPTATSITTNSATLGANVTSDGGASLSARGVCWGTSPAPTTNCVAEGSTTTGIFTQATTGLATGATIYYRGYATNSAGTGYSPDGTFTTLFSPATVDWNNGNVQEITLTAGRSLTFSNGKNGGAYSLLVKQDATGGRSIAWPSDVKWAGATTPSITSAANAVDVVKFIYDGTNYVGLVN